MRLGTMAMTMTKAWAWVLDYLYVSFWQVRGLLIRDSAQELLQDVRADAVPVLLIPGIYENWRFLRPVANRLHAAGHPVHVVARLGYNRGTIPAMAELVENYLLEQNLRNVVVVAHSKGGLIGKCLMTGTSAADRVSAMVAVNTPFSGSVYAKYAPARTIRAFSPNDPLLLRLASNLEVNSRITAIYSSFDPHIPGDGQLAGGTNIRLAAMGHFRVLGDPALLQAVGEAVARRPDAAPSARDAGADAGEDH
ncbi:alpha/beta hydrolase [Paeniglutamicibacter antarcticus]|uniref:Alpha/beta hydrolase n=1 Tax=Arthrobacter terrae TaxID=2935737 RepID=A0A931G5H2_9MICC|nr:alpha/beta fold hydrolase [Arthrobacter terrae]MBG0739948.1 alpha/beta hydrolase [Arthrobacter terrae]